MDIPDIDELRRQLEAIPREIGQVVCMNCGKEFTAEIWNGSRLHHRCSECAAKRAAEENNEGDVPSPDGSMGSCNDACQAVDPKE